MIILAKFQQALLKIMITFKDILKAIYKQYSVDFCFVADNLGIEDEIVQEWETGDKLPSEDELTKFSEMFAIPLPTLKKSIENQRSK